MNLDSGTIRDKTCRLLAQSYCGRDGVINETRIKVLLGPPIDVVIASAPLKKKDDDISATDHWNGILS